MSSQISNKKVASTTNVSKRFGYSIVAATFFAQALALGLSIGIYPVFMQSIETEFGIGRALTSLGIPLVLVVGALISPALGRWVDVGSPRKIMLIGAIFQAAGLALLSQVSSLWMAMIAWIGLVGIGQAMLGTLPNATIIANWFVVKRGTMIAISATGITFGAAIAPPLSEFLIATVGWRGALLSLGSICLIIASPIIFFGIVKSPEELGMHPDGASNPPNDTEDITGNSVTPSFISDHHFWLISLAFTCMIAATIGLTTHLVAWAQELGISREHAVLMLSANAIAAACGKLVFGNLCDRIGPRNTVFLAVCFELLGWITLLNSSSALFFGAGGTLFFLGAGAMVPCQASYIGSVWKRSNFGQAMGFMGLIIIVGIFLAPTLIGIGFESFGSYRIPMLALTGAIMAPVVFLGGLGQPSQVRTTHT
jgi:MFS family permease